jgi:hypothetical protein
MFRRLCIDVEDTGLVLGGSVEWYEDDDPSPHYVGVCEHEHVFAYGMHAMLDHLADTVIIHIGYPHQWSVTLSED